MNFWYYVNNEPNGSTYAISQAPSEAAGLHTYG